MIVLDGKIANRTDEITEEEWLEINKTNRDMVQDYLDNQYETTHMYVIREDTEDADEAFV